MPGALTNFLTSNLRHNTHLRLPTIDNQQAFDVPIDVTAPQHHLVNLVMPIKNDEGGEGSDSLSASNDPRDLDDDDGDDGGGGLSDDAKIRKRRERLEQNRISARESRKRKKNMIEELQRTVITLSREHKELNQRNETLKQQLVDIHNKVRAWSSLVCVRTLYGCFTRICCFALDAIWIRFDGE